MQSDEFVGNRLDNLFYRLELPDLHGMKLLELFSGSEPESLKHHVQGRGGEYFSLDWKAVISGGTHTLADAYALPFKDATFNFVIMNNPPSVERAGVFFRECLRVLKKKSGSSVVLSHGIDKSDHKAVMDNLRLAVPSIDTDYDVSFEAERYYTMSILPRSAYGIRIRKR